MHNTIVAQLWCLNLGDLISPGLNKEFNEKLGWRALIAAVKTIHQEDDFTQKKNSSGQ